MNRKPIIRAEVTRIIVAATMTIPAVSHTPESLLAGRKADGYFDVGWHYYIDRQGTVHSGVPLTDAGSYAPRYSANSVVLLMEGGRETLKLVSADYTQPALRAASTRIRLLEGYFPNAETVLWCQLYKGVNPVIDLKGIHNVKRQST